jgi:hypothetical protein
MLKKTGYIIIAVMLLFATSGVTIYRHYCCGSLVGTSLYSTPHHCCKANCPGCRNEIINLRIADQFESFQTQVDLKAGFKTLLEQHSLPTLRAFSMSPDFALFNDSQGDHSIKPYPNNPVYAGNTNAFLQVFLF